MNYLEALKNKKRLPHVLPLLPKGQNNLTHELPLLPKDPFGTFGSTWGRHISKIEKAIFPPPQPKGLGLVYENLWIKAWGLADQIDDHKSGIPVEDRRAMMPELDQMRAELQRLESLGALPPGSTTIEPAVKQTDVPMVQAIEPGVCPAKCKVSGTCCGRAFFTGKSGKVQQCGSPCLYADQLETFFKNKKEKR